MSRLILMMGIPASGKSEYAKKAQKWIDNSVVISRDEIRFELTKDGDSYFKNEKKVFSTFCERINQALKNGYTVIADATHVDRASRKKVLSHIDPSNYDRCDIFCMQTPLAKCLLNNEKRIGKQYVPEKAIKDMWQRKKTPIQAEGFDNIYYVFNYTTTSCAKGKAVEPFV